MLHSKIVPLSLAAALCIVSSEASAQTTPPLTSVQIIRVESALNGGPESISPSQTTTVNDHGGTPFRVTVRELGYGSAPRVNTLNGTTVSNSAEVLTGVCGTTSAPTTPCQNGQIVIGYDRTYQIDGQTGGTYSATVRNSKSPFNSITDTLVIR